MAKNLILETAIKQGLVLGAGAIVGAALDATHKVPKQLSAPALGVLGASFIAKKFKGVSPLAITLATGLQGMKTIPELGIFKKLEARAEKIGGKGGGVGAGAGVPDVGRAAAGLAGARRNVQQTAAAVKEGTGIASDFEKIWESVTPQAQGMPLQDAATASVADSSNMQVLAESLK